MDENIKKLINKEDIKNIGRIWHGEVELEPVDEVQNIIHKIRINKIDYILRIKHESDRGIKEVEAEYDWILFLADKGVKVCKPLNSSSGKLIEEYKAEDGSLFYTSIFEMAPGSFLRGVEQEYMLEYGKTLGQFHKYSKAYDDTQLEVKRDRWSPTELLDNIEKFLPQDFNNRDKFLSKAEKLVETIKSIPVNSDNYGLIHHDFNPTNFHAHEGDIHVFDFDDCCYNWFVYDLTLGLSAFSLFSPMKEEEYIEKIYVPFLTGYLKENDIDPEIMNYIPALLDYQIMSSLMFSFMIDKANRELYDDWFQLVIKTYEEGHSLEKFDFRNEYKKILNSGSK